LDWVQRRKIAEENLEKAIDSLWLDVRIAVQSACQGFSARYDGYAEFVDIPNNNFKVRCRQLGSLQATLTEMTCLFDRSKNLLTVEYSPFSLGKSSKAFLLDADTDSAFIISKSGKGLRLSPDDVSCDCLEQIFFPNSGPTSGWKSNPRVI
jgi:hypothetical protein